MTQRLSGVLQVDLIGGYDCLNFTNTVHDYEAEARRDELQTYGDLVRWSRRIGTIADTDEKRLIADAERDPRRAAAVLDEARSIRGVFFKVFSAVADGQEPDPDDLSSLSRSYAEAMRNSRITKAREGYGWRWEGDQSMRQMLWPVVSSAVELLTSPDLANVRKCASDRCTWLFVDKSKNHSRRWCEMGSCGNREKSRRHYHRTRSAKA
jgi:predicted RNA-binding Zn ribbon-like protein